ncbi:MAG: hypothetical protein H7Y42_19335 [Chitinophagaceae bacterium]|nr:hypothetical protein [Chitinophagaceae bacterium]
MAKFLIYLITFVVFGFEIQAQDNCPTQAIYRTDSLGTLSSKLRIPMFVLVKKDSIKLSFDIDGKNDPAIFRILEKKCEWNLDMTIGYTEFNVVLIDSQVLKPARIIIHNKENNVRYIEVLYEGKEERILTIRSP